MPMAYCLASVVSSQWQRLKTGRVIGESVSNAEGRVRLRDLGVEIGVYPVGKHNAITDVAGVEVGHATVSWGDGSEPLGQGPARSGVTAIWPQREGIVHNPV